MSAAKASIEITASSSRLLAGLNAARAKFQSFAGSVARGMGGAFKGVNKHLAIGETGKRAIGNFGGDMMTRGLDAVTDAATGVRDFERDLTRLGITANRTPEQIAALREAMRQTSRDTGISSAEIVKAGGVYFDLTSDADGMTQAMKTFARVAQASGANMADITTAAAALQDSLQIKPDQMEAVFSGLINQGKAGKIGLKDFGAELVNLAPKFAKMGGAGGIAGVMQLGAAFQVAAKGFGSASEASTGLEALIAAFEQHAKTLAKYGHVKVFETGKDGVKRMRDLHSIVKDIGASKLVKDPELMRKALGDRKEALDTIAQLVRLPGLYDDIAAAGANANVVNEDLGKYLDSDAGRLDLAFNKMKETIASVFTPERIVAFTNAVESLADKLGPLVDMLGKAGDALGGIAGVGKSVRGFFNGNTNDNPWKESAVQDEAMIRTGGAKDGSGGPFAAAEQDPKKRATNMRIALRHKYSRMAYDTTVENIMGGEVNDRTSKESILRAARASVSSRGNESGTQLAGAAYLANAKVTNSQRDKLLIDDITRAVKEGFDAVKALSPPPAPVVQLGDNQVSKSVSRATRPRTRP